MAIQDKKGWQAAPSEISEADALRELGKNSKKALEDFYKKRKEKKSRLKSLEDLLESLPDRFKKPDIDPDILEKLLPKLRERDFWKKIRPVPMPEMEIDPDAPKPVPMPEMELDPSLPRPVPMPEIDPRYWDLPKPERFDPERGPDPRYRDLPKPERFDPKRGPDRRYWDLPTPKRFDPERGPDPRYLLEAMSESEELIEVFDTETNQNVFISRDKLLEDEGRYSPIRKAGGGIMDINRMTAPLGYALGGPAGMTEPERKSAQPITIEQIMRDAEASKGPGEQGIISKAIYKLAGDPVIDPIWKAKQFIKEKILRRTPEDQGSASGMHPLVEFQEMYDQYIIDGGDMSFKEFFDMLQIELDKMAGD